MRHVYAPFAGCFAGAVGWVTLGTPGQLPGMAAFMLAFAVVIPLALLALIFGTNALAYAAVPCRWRVWWRAGIDRGQQRSARIPAWLRRAVMIADGGRCVYCGSPVQPQLDHVKPWSCGGHTALGNLVVLCAFHNRVKSNYWQTRHGRVIYSPFAGADNERLAARILHAERVRRLNVWRWVRAAHGLWWL